MIKFFRVALCFLYLWGNVCSSQTLFSNVKYQVETGSFLSTSGIVPFWLRSNQYGIVPLHSPILTFRGSAHKEYDSTENNNQKLKKFGIGYGFWGVANVGKQSGLLLPEAYLKVRYGAFEFYGGRRREIIGLVDTTLTSGSYIWSGNALPIPKIQISIPNYTSIIGHGLVSIKGGYAHGWFDNGLVQNSYLHQKWFYGRVGKSNWMMKFYAGFNHQVQWGGRPSQPYLEPQTGASITKYPSNFATYLKVVAGVSLNINDSGTNAGIPLNDAWNRAGNHLGTIDIAAEINLKNSILFLYRQSIYDDGSLFYLNNITDGLFGISLKPKKVRNGLSSICFEYLNTTNQGGNTGSGNTIAQLRGQDNYFNNSLYINSWTYRSIVLGTPFITPLSSSYIKPSNLGNIPNSYIVNNRINGYNIALSGNFQKLNLTTKLMFSNNLGLYASSLTAKQFSFFQQINYKLSKCIIISNFSFDSGELYKNGLSVYLGIRRGFL